MSYVVFDMDETIAQLSSVYYFIATLTATNQETTKSASTNKNAFLMEPLEPHLPVAYDYFVQRVLKEEQSDRPLGILRPGILDIMEALYQLKKKHLIHGVVIYSNNSHLNSLYFIRDLIHVHYPRLILDCIHWLHPLRKIDREQYHRTVGAVSKTWENVKNLMNHGLAKAPPFLEPNEVHFFDDQFHISLKRALNNNYHQIPPYQFKASFDRIVPLFLSSLSYAEVDLYELENKLAPLYPDLQNQHVINRLNKGNTTLLEDILDLFRYYVNSDTINAVPSLDTALPIAEVIATMEHNAILHKGGTKKKRMYTIKRKRRTIRR